MPPSLALARMLHTQTDTFVSEWEQSQPVTSDVQSGSRRGRMTLHTKFLPTPSESHVMGLQQSPAIKLQKCEVGGMVGLPSVGRESHGVDALLVALEVVEKVLEVLLILLLVQVQQPHLHIEPRTLLFFRGLWLRSGMSNVCAATDGSYPNV